MAEYNLHGDNLTLNNPSMLNLNSGISNAKFSLSGTTLTLSTADSKKGEVSVSLPDPANPGSMVMVNFDSLSLTLASSTVTGAVAKITTAIFGNNSAVAGEPTISLFAYVAVEVSGGVYTPYLMLSRSPNIPNLGIGSYIHTNSATTRTVVGGIIWGIPWIGKNGTIVGANTSCICIGQPVAFEIDRTNGRASSGILRQYYCPTVNDKVSQEMEFAPVYTGFSTDPDTDGAVLYRIEGQFMYLRYAQNSPGTSNATTFTLTVPLDCAIANMYKIPTALDNTANVSTAIAIVGGTDSNILDVYKDAGAASYGVWTGSGSKDLGAFFNFLMDIDY